MDTDFQFLSILVYEEEGACTAHCLSVDTPGYGNTVDEAVEDMWSEIQREVAEASDDAGRRAIWAEMSRRGNPSRHPTLARRWGEFWAVMRFMAHRGEVPEVQVIDAATLAQAVELNLEGRDEAATYPVRAFSTVPQHICA